MTSTSPFGAFHHPARTRKSPMRPPRRHALAWAAAALLAAPSAQALDIFTSNTPVFVGAWFNGLFTEVHAFGSALDWAGWCNAHIGSQCSDHRYWNVVGNWNNGAVPGAFSDVRIEAGHTVRIGQYNSVCQGQLSGGAPLARSPPPGVSSCTASCAWAMPALSTCTTTATTSARWRPPAGRRSACCRRARAASWAPAAPPGCRRSRRRRCRACSSRWWAAATPSSSSAATWRRPAPSVQHSASAAGSARRWPCQHPAPMPARD